MAAIFATPRARSTLAKRILLLTHDPALVPPGGSLVVCSVAGPVTYYNKEPAGCYYHLEALKQRGLWEEPISPEELAALKAAEAEVQDSPSAAGLDQDQPPAGVNWKGNKNKQKKVKRAHDMDLYNLLGLQNERWTANEAQIKAAYKKTCLTEHPDKKLINVTDPDEKKAVEDRFKTIQEAYEVLSDPAKRREFDSVDTFDDTLPTSCDPADFFKVFAPAFRRNARWSTDAVAPDVGDDTLPIDDVEKFYTFWFKFKSWREFPHEDEEDVEGAESREHKRWIERNNGKLREKAKKDEGKRLRKFVEDAYMLDPRVLRRKDDERLAREKKKTDKEDARRKIIEDEQRKKDEAAASLAAAEAAEKESRASAKVDREAAKKLMKTERKRLRILIEDAEGGGKRLISDDQQERLTTKLDLAALQDLCNHIAASVGSEERKLVALDMLDELDLAEAEELRAKEASKKGAEATLKTAAKEDKAQKAAAMAEWESEELRMLDKALAKWPQGTAKRWEQVTAYVRTRTMDEVLMMVKERKGASTTRMKAQEDWKNAQKKPTELKAIADVRASAFTDVEVNLSGDAVVHPPPVALGNGAAPAETNGAAEPEAAGTSGAADSTKWSEEQELALVAALKQFGKELTDRWDRIGGGVVPGKSKAQCFKRFKELRDSLRAKKAAAGEAPDADE